MAGDFVAGELNRYLNDRSLISLWARVGRALRDEPGEDVRLLLLDAKLHLLFQYDAMPDSAEEAAARFSQVRNAVNKQVTSSARAQVANAVRAGLAELEKAQPRINPANLSLWAWYFPALSDLEAERGTEMVDQILRQYGPVGAADEQDLRQRLNSSGLSESGKEAILERIPSTAVRVVPTLPPDLLKRLDAIDALNVVELIRPQSWQEDADLQYSAFSAQPVGEAPVVVAELADAISYFDARNQQTNKDALVKLAERCRIDEELHEVVLSYHLVKIREARRSGFPQEVVRDFQKRGLTGEDAARLLGGAGPSPEQPEASDDTAVSAPPVAVPDDDVELDSLDEIYLEAAFDSLVDGQLQAAQDQLEAITDREVLASTEVRDLANMISGRWQIVNEALAEGDVSYGHGDFARAVVALRKAQGVGADVPAVHHFGLRLQEVARRPDVIQTEMERAALVPHSPDGVNLKKKVSSTLGFFFKYIGPASLADHLFFHAAGGAGPSGVGHYLVAVVLLVIGMIVLSAAARARARGGKKWPTVLLGTIVGLTLFVNMYWFTLVVVIVYLARYRKMYLAEAVPAWNTLVAKTEEILTDEGLASPIAGIYRYQKDKTGVQVFPGPGTLTRPIESSYGKDGDSKSLTSDDLVLLDGSGKVVTHVKEWDLPPEFAVDHSEQRV